MFLSVIYKMSEIKSESELRKKCVIFGLEDVLVPGKLEENVDLEAVFGILQNLKGLEERFARFRFFVVSGYSIAEGNKRLEQHGLKKFVQEDRVFFVNQEYLEGREEVDKKLYEKNIAQNPEFKDEYFKQKVIEDIAAKFDYAKEDMVLIGHDVWTEGYYTFRFSQIEFALIRSAHASLGEKKEDEIKNLTYINRTWEDIVKLIKGEFPKPDYALLQKFFLDKMGEKLFEGTKVGALKKISG